MDASKVGLGAVLEQQHGEEWRPIAFWSRKLKDPETRYSATDLEWMAVVHSVTRVWYWLLDGKFLTIRSDHQALQRKLCKSVQDPPLNDRQARWIESMSRYSFAFEWLKGSQNPVADALSRQPVGLYTTTVIDARLVGIWRRMKMAAEDDPDYRAMMGKVGRDELTRHKIWNGLVIDEQGRIVVPEDDAL